MLHFIKPLMVFSHDTQWVSNGYLPSNMGICFYKNACKGQGHGQYKNQAHLDPPCTSLYSQLCPIMPTALGVTNLHINNSNHNLLLPNLHGNNSTSHHGNDDTLIWEPPEWMRHNFWKEREILARSSVLLLPNFNLKKYDFNLYKGVFHWKKMAQIRQIFMIISSR